MPVGPGGLRPTRVARGFVRRSGRMSVSYRWMPDWERKTFNAVRVSGSRFARMVHQGMVDAMATVSRYPGGGAVEENEDHWMVGVGTAPATHLYWHLLEFGGGFHSARAPVRNAMTRFGRFKPLGRGGST